MSNDDSDMSWLDGMNTTKGFDRARPAPQRVLNESWPPLDVARRLKDVDPNRQIPIVARVELEQDGVQEMPGTAVRWTREHVCVRLGDQRLLVPYVWLAPSDVRRA